MTNELLYYAVYDVSSNKRRANIVIKLKNSGMTRIQKSVFCGTLNTQQLKDLKESLKPIITSHDKIYIIRTCEKCVGKIETIGEPFDLDYVSNKKSGEVF
jgi:CRISPR-associated endonuclease Cas2